MRAGRAFLRMVAARNRETDMMVEEQFNRGNVTRGDKVALNEDATPFRRPHGIRLLFYRFNPRGKPGNLSRYACDLAIFTFNVQKLQCNFNHIITGMGHLGGGSERDASLYRSSCD